MNFMPFLIKFIKFKPIIKFKKFELHNYDWQCEILSWDFEAETVDCLHCEHLSSSDYSVINVVYWSDGNGSGREREWILAKGRELWIKPEASREWDWEWWEWTDGNGRKRERCKSFTHTSSTHDFVTGGEVRYGCIGGLEYEVPQKLTHLLQCIGNL